jgi:hypothetical protein
MDTQLCAVASDATQVSVKTLAICNLQLLCRRKNQMLTLLSLRLTPLWLVFLVVERGSDDTREYMVPG